MKTCCLQQVKNVCGNVLQAAKDEAPGASRVSCFVDFGICISQLDCDIPLKLILEAYSLDARDSFHQS